LRDSRVPSEIYNLGTGRGLHRFGRNWLQRHDAPASGTQQGLQSWQFNAAYYLFDLTALMPPSSDFIAVSLCSLLYEESMRASGATESYC
jgi:hypothetical protein